MEITALNCRGAWLQTVLRGTAQAAVLGVTLLLSGTAHAQSDYPNKPVRIVVPFAPGGPGDVIARLLATKLSEDLGKQFYIENQPGAGGNLGTATVARAPADGYTLLVASSHFTINPSLYAKVPYDPLRDFKPVTLIATSPNVLVVHPSVEAKTVKELVDMIRANPGKHSYAMPGAGTPAHLSGEMFRVSLKLDIVAVPFGGGGPMIQSVVAGHTPIAFSSMPPAAPQVQGGKLRALAVTSAKRSVALPDTPTMIEAGFPEQQGATPQGIFVPAGTPQAIVDLLYRETARIVALPDVKAKMAAIGFEPIANTPAEFAADVKAEIPKWEKLVREANIKME